MVFNIKLEKKKFNTKEKNSQSTSNPHYPRRKQTCYHSAITVLTFKRKNQHFTAGSHVGMKLDFKVL